MRLFRFIALFALAVSAQAQTWFTVVPASAQSTSTTITMPVGAQYRFSTPICGATGKPAASATGTATASPVSDWDAGAVDPCPGTAKEFDVLETAATQIVTVTTSGAAKSVTVPALAAPAPTTQTLTCTVIVPSFPVTYTPGMSATAANAAFNASFQAAITNVTVTCK